jgi:hypothetical protein
MTYFNEKPLKNTIYRVNINDEFYSGRSFKRMHEKNRRPVHLK